MSLPAAAVDLARQGLAVFPLRVRDKPPLPSTTGLLAASADPELARGRWAGVAPLPLKPDSRAAQAGRQVFANPHCNIAIATGAISGVWVFDLDGPDAEAAVAALEAIHGKLPHTVEQVTGKGRHILFAWDPARPVRNMSKRSRERIGPDIDVRGDGGYIVAPPSIHPSGRVYAWALGRAPGEIAFAPAPDWLMDLVTAPDPAAAPAEPIKPRPQRDGRASPYGEAVLASAEREISNAAPGSQNDTLWRKSILVGCYVAGGEIERGYARDTLERAGLMMRTTKGAWTPKLVADTVERAFTWGEAHPSSAPERSTLPVRAAEPGRAREAPAADVAADVLLARRLWSEARGGWVRGATDWLRTRGLEPSGLPDALASRIRVHAEAPRRGSGLGPALIAPLVLGTGSREATIAGVLVQPIGEAGRERAFCVGDRSGRVAVLHRPAEIEGVLVALTLQDAWALGTAAREEAWELLVVVAPAIDTFAGRALGDRFGRIDPDTPHADPDRPPWRLPACAWPVQLAVRRDLRSPPLRVRKAEGGTREVQLEGDAAARFYGGLAEQHWRAAEANAVRVLRPTRGVGFCEGESPCR